MRQVIQDLKAGVVRLMDVPVPVVGPGTLLVRTTASLVSAGTERMLVDFGRAGWLERARQQPDRVRQVLGKMATDGVAATLEAVQRKLEQPMPLGYSNVGVVTAVGEGVSGFSIGDRILSNGPHAGFVCVARNLCAVIPDGVDDESATFAVIGAIALQGVRLAAPTLGETFMVSGLGMVGLLAVQLLRANGCRVIGADFDSSRLDLARGYGAQTVNLAAGEDPVAAALAATAGVGVDGVLVCVASDSDEPMRAAAQMSRQRGRIVLVGVAGLQLARDDFYRKELTFQVSCSYGPGRYDSDYEELGRDYPLAFVRWTEQRNFQAVLQLMAEGRLEVRSLISHRFPLADATVAYEQLTAGGSLGILFDYRAESAAVDRLVPAAPRSGGTVLPAAVGGSQPVLAAIGAGGYGGAVLLPAFRAAGARFKMIVSARGLSASQSAAKLEADFAASDYRAALSDPEITAVVIATRHDSHAAMTIEALQAGKFVFVEKPLAINHSQIEALRSVVAALPGARLMVGFNRRYAPLVAALKTAIDGRSGAKAFIYTVNAGAIPPQHWTQRSEGGGRIIGEACHFVDLLRFLAGARIVGANARYAADHDGRRVTDVATLSLSFADGSIGTIHYLANGSARFPKERIEVFAGGGVLVLDNFRRLRSIGWAGVSSRRQWRQDKGQRHCAAQVVAALRSGGAAPIPVEELFEVAEWCCRLAESSTGEPRAANDLAMPV